MWWAPYIYRRRPLMIKPSQSGFRPSENHTTALAGEEMHSPFGGWRHHLARWEACHWIRGSRGSPMNPVPLPLPQFGGAAKGKRLNGQARRLTSPHLEVLCRMCTVDNKAPQRTPFTQRIAKNKVPPPGERWWRQPPKGEMHFLARRAVVGFSHGRKPGC